MGDRPMRNLIATICLAVAVLIGSAGVSWSADLQKGLAAEQIIPPNAASKLGVCNSYDNDFAFRMGERIQDVIRRQSLEDMIDLLNFDRPGSRTILPRLENMKGKTFNDIFPVEWQKKVLASTPSCLPHSWRGYILTYQIWYDHTGIFQLRDINFFNKSDDSEGGIWTFKELSLTPACFDAIWMSGDNFAAISGKYWFNHKAPGLSLAKSLPFHPIPAWDIEDINIIRPLKKCALPATKVKMNDGWISNTENILGGSHEYTIIKTLPLSLCSILAPHVEKQRCLAIKLIGVADKGGGSMGQTFQSNIYGLVTDVADKVYVAPLENFDNHYQALNRVDILLGR